MGVSKNETQYFGYPTQPDQTQPILKREETDEKTFALCLYGTSVSIKLLAGQ